MSEIRHTERCCQDPDCQVTGCGGCNCGAAERAAAASPAWTSDAWFLAACVAVYAGSVAGEILLHGWVSHALICVAVASLIAGAWRVRGARLRNPRAPGNRAGGRVTYYAAVIVFALGVGVGGALAYLHRWAGAYTAFAAGALAEFLAACLKSSLIMAALSVAACLWCGWRCGRHLAWRVR